MIVTFDYKGKESLKKKTYNFFREKKSLFGRLSVCLKIIYLVFFVESVLKYISTLKNKIKKLRFSKIIHKS